MAKWLHSRHTANQRGYSLVEIFATLGVAAILAVASLPTLTRVLSAPPESDQLERLRRALSETRNRTIMADVCATATISGTDLTVVYYRECSTSPPSDPFETRNFQFPNLNMEPFDSGPTLQFAMGGGLTQRRPATMKIHTSSNRHYEIRILPAIGNIRMNERAN